MYKILVADSDPESLLIIQNVIEREVPDARIVAVAKNGNDAVVETINNEPDLILIGIRIMGLNGLDTIERIRSFNRNVHIIIVSAYDYFEFAKRAMTLGVNDYLLKPVDESTLRDSVITELAKVGEEEERKCVSKNEESQFTNALRFVEQNFIYSVAYNTNFEDQLEEYRKLLGIGDYGYIIGITIEPSFLKNQWDVDKMSNRVYRRLKDIVSAHAPCAIGPRILNRFIVYVTSSYEKASREGQVEAIQLAKDIVHGLRDTFDLESKVAIGGIKRVKQIQDSYLEMLKSHRYDNGGVIVYYKEVRYKNGLRESYMDLTESLIESIKYDRHSTGDCFARILELLRPLSSEERLTRLMEVFMAVAYEFRKELKNQDIYYDYLRQCDYLMQLDVEEQELWAYSRLNVMIKMMKASRNDRKSSVITMAMEYIQKHYNEEISLNDISHYVNLSPQHFSKIFKETTNFNYVEWVNNLRITKAKEYMNQDDYTIKEVCYLVGYKDPNYFSRIFKKYVGISPSEYMKERSL